MITYTNIDHRPFVPGARFDAATDTVHIHDLRLDDPIVIAEARRWSSGERGPSIDADTMDGADLDAFVRHSLTVGVHAITAAGNVHDKLEFAQLVDDLGNRTGQAAEQAAAQTAAVVTEATEALQRVAADARRALLEAQLATRKDFADQISLTRSGIEQELTRAFGGDDPALLARLRPVLDKFGADVQRAGVEETRKLVAQTGRLFDVDDPTSPLARQAARLREQQADSEKAHAQRSRELEAKIAELTTVVERAFAGKQATDQLREKTPAKGIPYEDAVHAVMHAIAAGLGDTYAETGTTTGAVARSKKGDAVLRVVDDNAAVVLEMTCSDRPDWVTYLDEAERNRTAQASLGLVPDASLLGGQTICCLGARRVVMVFDPDNDDPAMLRTVLQVLRLAARTSARAGQSGSIDTVAENVALAFAQLESIDAIQKSVNLTRKHANDTYVQIEKLHEQLERFLTKAKTALAAVDRDAELDAA